MNLFNSCFPQEVKPCWPVTRSVSFPNLNGSSQHLLLLRFKPHTWRTVLNVQDSNRQQLAKLSGKLQQCPWLYKIQPCKIIPHKYSIPFAGLNPVTQNYSEINYGNRDIHGSIIHKNEKLEAIQMFKKIRKWLSELAWWIIRLLNRVAMKVKSKMEKD